MFENPFKNKETSKNNEKENKKEKKFAPEIDRRTGVVLTGKEVREEREKRIEDPFRYRDLK
ncbi:hypothetical protein JW698_00590 [Candidatus Wolfebacteria bacterium]|nr:hypothetical protein [Candidatus Wolfebacteria bacterium]